MNEEKLSITDKRNSDTVQMNNQQSNELATLNNVSVKSIDRITISKKRHSITAFNNKVNVLNLNKYESTTYKELATIINISNDVKLSAKNKRSKSVPINARNMFKTNDTNKNNDQIVIFSNGIYCICCKNNHTQQQIIKFINYNSNNSIQNQVTRRTNFSRKKYYGSLELLFTLDREFCIQNIGRFRIEKGSNDEYLNTSNTIHLENPESQTRWYFKYFLGRAHQNYLIEDKNHNISFLSIVITDANEKHIPLYKAILWTKFGAIKLTLPFQENKQITVKQILNRFQIEIEKSPKEIVDPEIQRELLTLEEQEGSINFKFGIVYAKQGQLTDDEMLSNEQGSQEFEKFINLIGDKIRLKNWRRYRGGLDITSDTTGEYSIYTIYEGHEIMFHVSTLLPYTKDCKQQLERKRHIGNDIVTIVFQELDDDQEPDFNPSSARSQFQHIFALVTFNKKDNSYRLKIASEQSVPPFGPSLPSKPIFSNHQEFREFLLVKLINGEKAAFNNTVFGKRRKRTIEAIVSTLYENFEKDNQKTKANLATGGLEAITDVLISTNSNKKKEEQRKVEFLRIGQNLKLQTILKGDAPTSQLTTGLMKKEILEPQVYLQNFEYSITCSDSWNDLLVIGTNEGIFVLDEAIPWELKEIFDKSVLPKQINICETFGLMVILFDKGRICVFHLSELDKIIEDCNDHSQIKTKVDCKNHKLDVNGCHLYAINKTFSTKPKSFRIATVCGKKIQILCMDNKNTVFGIENSLCNQCFNKCNKNIFVTNSSSTPTPLPQNVSIVNEIVNQFKLKKEINCSDVPQLINLVDLPSENSYIFVAYKTKCEIICEATGEVIKQFSFNSLSSLRSIVEFYDTDEMEYLITYNYTSEFIKLDEQQSQSINNSKSYYAFQWNSEPNFVICAFPYIIGFANQSIEIRLLVNGNLVNSIIMQNINVISSKKDIYFSADHEDAISKEYNERNFIPLLANTSNSFNEEQSPPSSPSHNIQDSSFGHASNNPATVVAGSKQRQRCTIYKISLDVLLNPNTKLNDKMVFNQLCEDSKRNIQRELNSTSYLMIDPDDSRLSIYHKLITPSNAAKECEHGTKNDDLDSEFKACNIEH